MLPPLQLVEKMVPIPMSCVVHMPVVCNNRCPWVSECSKLRILCSCSPPTRSPTCRTAEADVHGPACLDDHRDSNFLLYAVIGVPVVQVVQVSQVVDIPVATQRLFPMP